MEISDKSDNRKSNRDGAQVGLLRHVYKLLRVWPCHGVVMLEQDTRLCWVRSRALALLLAYRLPLDGRDRHPTCTGDHGCLMLTSEIEVIRPAGLQRWMENYSCYLYSVD